jgi:hypothetical protein
VATNDAANATVDLDLMATPPVEVDASSTAGIPRAKRNGGADRSREWRIGAARWPPGAAPSREVRADVGRGALRGGFPMKRTLLLAVPILVVLALAVPRAVSAPEARFPGDIAAVIEKMKPDGKIEMGLAKDGTFDAIEFHVPYEQLPQATRDALEKLLPGGEVLDAEIEYTAAGVSYEVTKRIDGKESEVLVDAGGKVVNWEIEVDAAKVPEAVRKAVESLPGKLTMYEEISDGAKKVTAYHVKKDEDGKKWKIAISPDGKVQEMRREMTAEIEVTVR